MTPSPTRPFERITRGVFILLVIVIVATIGYHILDPQDDRDWLDDIYFVVITISSVGYTEKTEVEWPVQLFTIGVIVFGMSAAAYTMGGLIQMMTEGEIQRAMGTRRRTREIQRLKNHVILCGYGRIGHTASRYAPDSMRNASSAPVYPRSTFGVVACFRASLSHFDSTVSWISSGLALIGASSGIAHA